MNFLDALNTKVSDIEKPSLLPAGTYVWSVHKPHKESISKDGKWVTIEVPCIPKYPYEDADDVSPDALAAYGDLKSGVNALRFMCDTTGGPVDMDKWLYNMRRFLLDTLRIEAEEEATLKELLAKMVGAEFIAQASHRHVPDRDETFCDVKNFAPIL